MAQCHICKAETGLYECGLPICLECVKKHELDHGTRLKNTDHPGAKQRHAATSRKDDC